MQEKTEPQGKLLENTWAIVILALIIGGFFGFVISKTALFGATASGQAIVRTGIQSAEQRTAAQWVTCIRACEATGLTCLSTCNACGSSTGSAYNNCGLGCYHTNYLPCVNACNQQYYPSGGPPAINRGEVLDESYFNPGGIGSSP